MSDCKSSGSPACRFNQIPPGLYLRVIALQDLFQPRHLQETLEILCHLPVDSEIGLLEAVHPASILFALVFVDGRFAAEGLQHGPRP
jgi:hypothetical protein